MSQLKPLKKRLTKAQRRRRYNRMLDREDMRDRRPTALLRFLYEGRMR